MMSSLPSEMLARTRSLPLKPAPVTLAGRFVRLEPLEPRHASALYAHSNGSAIELAGRAMPTYDADALIWRYLFAGPFADLRPLHSTSTRRSPAPTAWRCASSSKRATSRSASSR